MKIFCFVWRTSLGREPLGQAFEAHAVGYNRGYLRREVQKRESDGPRPLSARIAFGSLHIQASECFTDEKTVENISENPYLQYFLGLHELRAEPLFDPSMMTHFRKRFTADGIAKINEELYRRTHTPKDEPPHDGGNGGTLVLDAIAAPAAAERVPGEC